jgi:hypothetical protein
MNTISMPCRVAILICLATVTLALAGNVSTVHGQSPILRWADHYGGTEFNEAYAITRDDADNIVVVGEFDGTVDFGGGLHAAAGATDIFVAKFNSDGVYLWSRSFGDASWEYCKDVATDGSGNIVIMGSFFGSVDFGGGPHSSNGVGDVYIAKFDANGNFIWARSFGDDRHQYGCGLAVDDAENIIVTGHFFGTLDFGGEILTSAGEGDIFVAKFDAIGNHLWSDSYGDADLQCARSVAVDQEGNVVLTGHMEGTVDFGGGPRTSMDAYDIFIAKFSGAGHHVWSDVYGGESRQYAESIAVDATGNIVVGGYFVGVVDFGGDPHVSGFGYDICLAKFNAAGDNLWSRSYSGEENEYAIGVAFDSSGNIGMTGYFAETLDLGGGPLLGSITDDIYVAKFDADGNHVWSMGTGDTFVQRGRCVAVDSADNILATGHFGGTVDFGDGPMVANGHHVFVAKFGPTTTGVSDLPASDDLALRACPNPFNPTTTITYANARDEAVRLSVFDLCGRRIRTLVDGVQAAGGHMVRWDGCDGSGQAVGTGTYIVRLESGGTARNCKVVVLK